MVDLTELRRLGVLCSGRLYLAGQSTFETPVRLYDDVVLDTCTVGAYSYLNSATVAANTRIGRYCSIANRCYINPGQHPTNWLSTSNFPYQSVFGARRTPPLTFDSFPPITIGNDVWIGAQCGIMGGVTIGDGAVIGYGAVVTRDVPPYSIVVGSPARAVRRRFADDIVEALMTYRWWRFDLPQLAEPVAWDDPIRALDQLQELETRDALPLIDEQRTVTLNGSASSIARA